jgi:iron(III) transport system ATP-binding protein
MADRIVVMNQGSIDQIGTPAEVYRDPHTPFVADFVGKTNLLPATCAGDNRVQIGAQRFECEVDGKVANGAGLRVFFRPEDVIVRGVGGATPNSAAAVVEKVEFLGAYSRLTFRMNGIDQPLFADLSMNDMAEFHVKPGDTMRVAIPPDRVRVFEAAGA